MGVGVGSCCELYGLRESVTVGNVRAHLEVLDTSGAHLAVRICRGLASPCCAPCGYHLLGRQRASWEVNHMGVAVMGGHDSDGFVCVFCVTETHPSASRCWACVPRDVTSLGPSLSV